MKMKTLDELVWPGEHSPFLEEPLAYTRAAFEVHVSDGGGEWSKVAGANANKPGLEAMKARAKEYTRSTRQVRIVHVIRNVRILTQLENLTILSQEQIDSLKAKGTAALKGIPGVVVTEGFELSMSDMSHSPTRVSVSVYGPKVLGMRPSGKDDKARAARKEWDAKHEELIRSSMAAAEVRLKAMGINYFRHGQAFHLKP